VWLALTVSRSTFRCWSCCDADAWGAGVVVRDNEGADGKWRRRRGSRRRLEFSLFYFASGRRREDERPLSAACWKERVRRPPRLLAVWTPERHFMSLGTCIRTRRSRGGDKHDHGASADPAGSVVLPLHHPCGGEEWSVIDNLSGGRPGCRSRRVACGRFHLCAEEYERRRRRWWRGSRR